jgi:tetratricopeptide (TPR) repeat protein/O-antigen ligase
MTNATHSVHAGSESQIGKIASPGVPPLSSALIEAAWLAAVVLVPCLCNPHSESGFQPNKIAFFRFLSLIIAGAWVTKLAAGRPSTGSEGDREARSWFRSPLVAALGFLAFGFALSTAFSVNPYASLWGGYETAQGAFTLACLVILFAAVAAHLRTSEQMDCLVTAITVTSLPLALYGLAERAGYDALPQLSHSRVLSLLGHPMYFAAYLLLVIPLSVWRVLDLARERRAGARPRGALVVGLILYGFILAVQLLALVFTETRGAVLGLIAGLVFFALALGVLSRRRGLLLGSASAAFAVLFLLGLLNIPNGPFQRWTSLPILNRLSQTFSQKEVAASIRLDYWRAAARIMTSSKPLPLPPDSRDHLHWLRPLVGYGPETVVGVLSREYTYPGTDTAPENRLHNLVMDTWLTLGGLGVAALAAFFIAAFWQAYWWLGWIPSTRSNILYFSAVLGLPLAAAVAAASWRGLQLAGVALELGLAAGLVAYPVAAFLLGMIGATSDAPAPRTGTLLVAILAALVSHLVDMSFGFDTAATLILFWTYLGVIVAVVSRPALGLASSTSPAAAPAANEHPGAEVESLSREWSQRDIRRSAAITALLMAALLFAFIQVYWFDPLSAFSVLKISLTQLDVGHRNNPVLLPLLLLAWGACSLAFALNEGRRNPQRSWWPAFFRVLVISGLIAGGYAWVKAFQIAALGPVPDAYEPAGRALRQGTGYFCICLVFLAICLAFLFWIGWLSSRGAPPARTAGPVIAAGLGSAVLLGVLVWFTTVRFLWADSYCRWGDLLGSVGDEVASAEVLRHTMALDPRPLVYRGFYQQILIDLAGKSSDEAGRNERMREAERALLAGRGADLDRGPYTLGELYLEWAAIEPDPAVRLELAKKAASALDEALLLEPRTEMIWRDSAADDILFLGNQDSGHEKLHHAADLVRNQDQAQFAAYYAARCRRVKGMLLKREYGRDATEYYDHALSDAAAMGASTAPLQMAKGTLTFELGDAREAIACFDEAAKEGTDAEKSQAEAALAKIYASQGNMEAYLAHLARAQHVKPPTN